MVRTEISLFLKNVPGELGRLSALLGANGVNIDALMIQDASAYVQQLFQARGKSLQRIASAANKEVRGVSPPKAMLPFSTDWFMTWQPNVHASLFMAYFRFLGRHTKLSGLELIIKAYRMYLEKTQACAMDTVLSLTRAWTMVRFFDANMLQLATCRECGGEFVAHAYDPTQGYVCGLCHMPARAGKTRRAAAEAEAAAIA